MENSNSISLKPQLQEKSENNHSSIKEFVETIDYDVISGLQKIRTNIGNYFWKIITFAGLPFIWVSVGIIFAFFDMFHVSLVITFASLSPLAIVFPIQKAIKRRRPYDKHQTLKPLAKETHYSFPSGHTYYVTVNGVALALCYGGFYSLFLMMGLGIMVAVSRIYLGVHYLTDVAAAYFLGLLVAYVIYLCFPLIMVLHDLISLI
jgi:undecaprenyl-diphosphatase